MSSKKAVFEGETITITDSLSNKKSLPLPWLHVSYNFSRFLVYLDNINRKVNRGERRTLLYIIGMNKTVSRKSNVLCNKRGYYSVTELVLSCNNLFMTEFTYEKISNDFELLVYPKIVDYSESMIPLNKMLGDITVKRFIDPDPFTFKGIREYQSYDSFRQINWKATAKIGDFMSNIYDFTVFQEITVLLDLQNYKLYNREFVHEEAIRIAAFICRSCINKNIPVSMICPSADGSVMKLTGGSSAAHLEKIYTALAFIDLKKENDPVSDIIAEKNDNKEYILISSFNEKCIIEISSGNDTVTMEVRENVRN